MNPDPATRVPAPTGAGRGDLVAGLLAAAMGAAVLLYVRGFPELPGGQPGPALFPGIVGALLVLFGSVLTARTLWAGRGLAADGAPSAPTPAGRVDALAVLGLVVGYLLVVEVVGFVLTMGPLLFALMWRLGARPVVAAGAAVLTTGLIVLLFGQLLLVPLPSGLLG